jgi:hypothetical protein
MSTVNWHGLKKVRRAQVERLQYRDRARGYEPLIPPSSSLPEKHTEPDDELNLTDSRGRPITLPRVSILERTGK